MKQLELFPVQNKKVRPLVYMIKENDMWVVLNQQADEERMQEIARDVETWKQIEEENERERDEDLQAWFDVFERNGCEMFSLSHKEEDDQEFLDFALEEDRKEDEAFRHEIYEIMDAEIAV